MNSANLQGRTWLIVLSVFMLVINSQAEAEIMRHEKFSLCLPNLRIEEEERIVEFRVVIMHGLVTSITRIPPGWFIHIDLPLQIKTVVTAGSIIGAADLTRYDIDYFCDFLMIEVSERERPLLSVEMEIVTNTLANTKDSIVKKTYRFAEKDLKLRRQVN